MSESASWSGGSLPLTQDSTAALSGLAEQQEDLAANEVIERLRSIRAEQDEAFAADPVLIHVEACIEELERIAG